MQVFWRKSFFFTNWERDWLLFRGSCYASHSLPFNAKWRRERDSIKIVNKVRLMIFSSPLGNRKDHLDRIIRDQILCRRKEQTRTMVWANCADIKVYKERERIWADIICLFFFFLSSPSIGLLSCVIYRFMQSIPHRSIYRAELMRKKISQTDTVSLTGESI